MKLKPHIHLLFCLLLASFSYAQRPMFITQENHSSMITALDISQDGEWFATGSYDNNVKIWDMESGLLIQGFALYEAPTDLQFQQDRHFLYASMHAIETMPIVGMNLYTNEITGQNSELSVYTLERSISGRYQALGHRKGLISFYDNDANKSAYLQVDSLKNTGCLAFSSDETMLAAGTDEWGERNSLSIFETATMSTLYSFQLDSILFKEIYFVDNNTLLIYSEYAFQPAYYLLNIQNGHLTQLNIQGHGLAYSSALNSLFYIHERSIRSYQLKSALNETLIELDEKISTSSLLKLSFDQHKLIIAGRDIICFDLEERRLNYIIPNKNYGYDALLFTKGGLLFNSGDGDLSFMDLKNNRIGPYLDNNVKAGQIVKMTMDPSENYLAIATSDSLLIVYSKEKGYEYSWRFTSKNFVSLSIDHLGESIAASVKDSIYFFDLKSGEYTSSTDLGVLDVEKNLLYSPNGVHLALIAYSTAALWDVNAQAYKLLRSNREGSIEAFAFSHDGKYFALGGYGDSIEVYNTENLELVYGYPIQSDYVRSLAFVPNCYDLISGHRSGQLKQFKFKANNFELINANNTHYTAITELSISSDDNIIFSSGNDGRIIISELSSLRKIAQLATFTDGSWAIVDEEGRYDASNGGDIAHIHFVLNNEPIALSQLRERAFDPGLLQKLLGYSKEALLNISGLDSVKMYPELWLSIENNKLSVTARIRDRSLGMLPLYINGIERMHDIGHLLKESPTEKGLYTGQIDLVTFKSFYHFDEENQIGLIGYNADNFLSSRLKQITYKPDPTLKSYGSIFDKLKNEPKLYGIIIGTSNYRGDELDLKFADNDALRFADALQQTAGLLYQEKNVEVLTLTTSSEKLPTKKNIRSAFEYCRDRITTNDILVVYFSGHGATSTEEGKDYFYYLTADMGNSNVSDKFIRENFTISSNELAEWISELPVERNVLILDACFSGTAVNDLLAISKSSDGSNERAIQRMKHRLGTFILTGSAPDQVSFESAKFKQSLLTYALLNGMRGEKLVEDQFVDVYELFNYAAENVPIYASSIGTVQYPKIAQSAGSSFYIGKVDPSVSIQLEVIRPTIIRSQFIDKNELDDMLDLSYKADEALRNFSFKQPDYFDFSDVRNLDGAYYLRGEYVQNDGSVSITCILKRDRTEVAREIITIKSDQFDTFNEKLLEFVARSIRK